MSAPTPECAPAASAAGASNPAPSPSSPVAASGPASTLPSTDALPSSPAPATDLTPSRSPPLSPAARPFYPSTSSALRWADDAGDDLDQVDYDFSPSPPLSVSGSPRPATYLEAACSPRSSPQAAPARPAPSAVAAPDAPVEPTGPPAGQGRRRRRPGRRARKRRPWPQHMLAPGAASGRRRSPAADTVSRRRPRVDDEGFQEVVSRSTRRRLRQEDLVAGRTSSSSSPSPRIRPEMVDRRSGPARFVRSDSPPTPTASQAPSHTPSPPPPSGSPASIGARAASTDSHPMGAEPERCYVERTPVMDAEEARLRFALIGQVGNALRSFTAVDVASTVAAVTGLGPAASTVTPSYPESFLIICPSQDIRDRVLNSNPIPMAATYLSVRPWTRMVRASLKVLYYKVGLELDGIPEHAWDLDTARKLLAKYAWVERLDQATASKADMSTFKLTAWTKTPHGIPPTMILSVAEPEPQVVYTDAVMQRVFGNLEPYLREKRVLDYPIQIHLRSITDFHSRSPSPNTSSPSDNGDSGPDGNPDRSYGFRQGVGPRLSGFRRRDDGGAHGGAGAAAGNGEGTSTMNQGGGRHCHQLQDAGKQPRGTVLQKHFPKGDSNKSVSTKSAHAEDQIGDKETAVGGQPSAASTQDTGAMATDLTVPSATQSEHDSLLASELVWRRSTREQPEQDPMVIEAACLSQPTKQVAPTATDPMADVEPVVLPDVELLEPTASNTQAEPQEQEEPAGQTATVPVAQPDGPSGVGNTWAGRDTGPEDDDSDSSPPGFLRKDREHNLKLQAFSEEVQCKIPTPLAPKPPKTRKTQPPQMLCEMPKRSERLADHPLAKVASSKRAEVVLMRRFSDAPETAPLTMEDKQAYDKLYKESLAATDFEAMRDLIPALRNASPILGMQA
ncbi:unnamed protein product [Urochloa decumbens]|uniref:Uncharacterized protein n=1 Tax=Urochloa decumbens TaxID=240449 RepID=A0ABC8YKJ9_9POAL